MAAQQPRIVLASSSKYRRDLLSRLNVSFETFSPEVDETLQPNESGEHAAQRLAIAKAEKAAQLFSSSLVIGSDQTVVLGNDILGKPGDLERAKAQLAKMSGGMATIYTAIHLINTDTESRQSHMSRHEVAFRELSDEEIDRYVEKEDVSGCAGAAKIEGLGISLLKSVSGTDPTGFVGLPLIALCDMLRNEGLNIP